MMLGHVNQHGRRESFSNSLDLGNYLLPDQGLFLGFRLIDSLKYIITATINTSRTQVIKLVLGDVIVVE